MKKRITILSVVWLVIFSGHVFAKSSNPMHQKSFWRSATVAQVQALLDSGVDINHPSAEGLTPLALASMESSDVQVIETLLKAGADVNAIDADWGWTPLFLAAMNNDNPQVIDTLVAYGANVEERCVGINSTPLIDAVVHNQNPDIIMALLNAGADPNAHDDRGLSATDYVQQSNNQFKGTVVEKTLIHK